MVGKVGISLTEFDDDIVAIELTEEDLPPGLFELFDSMMEAAIRKMKTIDDEEHEGWWCINIKPHRCRGCGEMITYVEPPHLHLIIVWEDRDDPMMLHLFETLKKYGRIDPDIRSYHPMMGHCVAWEHVEDMIAMIPDEYE